MKRKLIVYGLIISSSIVFLISCSKNSTGEIQGKTEQSYLPKIISLEYSYGDTVVYELAYNSLGHIQKILMTRSTDGDLRNLVTDFEYDERFNLIKAITKDVSNGLRYEVGFTYDQLSIITDLIFITSGTEKEASINYLPLQNRYTVNGDLGNFPMIWDFNSEGQLIQMAINENVLTLELSNTNKGIFTNVLVQPALHIWYGLLFYLMSPELYFFSKKDIKSIATNEFPYLYDKRVRDGEGNLIFFQASYAGILTIDYTVTYENRNF